MEESGTGTRRNVYRYPRRGGTHRRRVARKADNDCGSLARPNIPQTFSRYVKIETIFSIDHVDVLEQNFPFTASVESVIISSWQVRAQHVFRQTT